MPSIEPFEFDEDTCIACTVIVVGNEDNLVSFKEKFEEYWALAAAYKMPDGYSAVIKKGYLELLFGYGKRADEQYAYDILSELIRDSCIDGKVFLKMYSRFAATLMDFDGCRYGIFKPGTDGWVDDIEEASWEFKYEDYYEKDLSSWDLNDYFIEYVEKKLFLFFIENNITEGSVEKARKACEDALNEANKMLAEINNDAE